MTVNPVDLYVGTRLKIKRSEMGLSQNKIGEMTGITFQQIQKYEKGQNRIGSSRLYEFAKILKVPVSYFFELYEATFGNMKETLSDNKVTFKNEADVSEKEIVALVKNFSTIKDPMLRKNISSLAKTLSKNQEKDEEENDQ